MLTLIHMIPLNTEVLFQRSPQLFFLSPQLVKDNRWKATHAFMSISFSNAVTCDICDRSLAQKPALQCQSKYHYSDVIMGAIASQITSLTTVYSILYSDADQRKHQSSASLAFVRGIHRGPVNSPNKWTVTWKMFPFDDVIMCWTSGAPLTITVPWLSARKT